MATPEFDPNDFTPGVSSNAQLPAEASNLSEGAKQFIRQYVPADDGRDVIVSFEVMNEFMPAKSRVASEAANKPVEIYEDVTYIRKSVRGNDKLEVVRPVREEDKREFPFSWQEFQKGNEVAERGTNIAKLPGVDAPTLRLLHSKNIFTVEDMAMVNDNNLQNVGMGARELRRKAIEYVKAHEGVSEAGGLRELVSKQSEDLSKAMALIERLSEENAKLSERKKPGPKPKTGD